MSTYVELAASRLLVALAAIVDLVGLQQGWHHSENK